MALTPAERLRAGRFFVRNFWDRTNKPAKSDLAGLDATLVAIDGWFDASPAGDVAPTRLASVVQAMPTAFRTNTDAQEKAGAVTSVVGVLGGNI